MTKFELVAPKLSHDRTEEVSDVNLQRCLRRVDFFHGRRKCLAMRVKDRHFLHMSQKPRSIFEVRIERLRHLG